MYNVKNEKSVVKCSADYLFDKTGLEEVLNRHEPNILIVEFKDYDEKVVLLSNQFLGSIGGVHEVDFVGEHLGPRWGFLWFEVQKGSITHSSIEKDAIRLPYRCRITSAETELIMYEFSQIRKRTTEIEYSMYYI